MNPLVKNILAVVAGWIIGSAVNMGFIILGSKLIPLPPEINIMDSESLQANAHLFEGRHFIFPFIAHALGTLVGAYVATKIAASYQQIIALIIGTLFLLGGLSVIMQMPSPTWFTILDLGLAYIPMALLGWRLSRKAEV